MLSKKGAFTDIFIFIIFGFIIALIIGIFIYIGNTATEQLHDSMDGMGLSDGNNNGSVVIDNTMGVVSASYGALRWLGVLIIFGMILGIFIGSYMVTTKPIFIIPFIFLQIIGIVVSVGIANAYNTLISNATLGATYATMGGLNWLILKLPMVTVVVGFVGGVIMFSRLGKKEEQFYGYQ